MTAPTGVDAELVKQLATLLDENRLTEIEYAWGEQRIRVSRVGAAAPVIAAQAVAPSPAASPAVPTEAAVPAGAIRSPMVGTVYLAPQPGAPPFVSEGASVAAGDTLFIIEAMKVMNQIRAPKAGTVTRILIEDSSPVEYHQPVMVLD